jgi:hypothetical protein
VNIQAISEDQRSIRKKTCFALVARRRLILKFTKDCVMASHGRQAITIQLSNTIQLLNSCLFHH